MILSLFIATSSRNICLEKHWRNVISRSVCDYFFEAENINSDEINPVIQTAHYYLINIHREKVYYIAVCSNEVPPLFIIEFLHRFVDILLNYFSNATENTIKDNIVRIYEILDEMIDNGFPLATELNVLEELVKPPNLFRTISDTVTGNFNNSMGSSLPSGQLSQVPWRRSGVKYNRNEAYFDIIEEITAIIDKSGTISHCEIDGYIECLIKLSGMPDLTMAFANPSIIDDVSLHPCIRYLRWMKERVVSFIPPDGRFRLMTYHTTPSNNFSLPLTARGSITWQDNGSKLDIVVTCRKIPGKGMSDLSVMVRMPQSVSNVTGNPSIGRTSYDTLTRKFTWTITTSGGITSGGSSTGGGGVFDPPARSSVSLRANVILGAGMPMPDSHPVIELGFKLHQYSASGNKVTRMDVFGEDYRPFKGVKYISKAGNYQISL